MASLQTRFFRNASSKRLFSPVGFSHGRFLEISLTFRGENRKENSRRNFRVFTKKKKCSSEHRETVVIKITRYFFGYTADRQVSFWTKHSPRKNFSSSFQISLTHPFEIRLKFRLDSSANRKSGISPDQNETIERDVTRSLDRIVAIQYDLLCIPVFWYLFIGSWNTISSLLYRWLCVFVALSDACG